LEEAKKFLLDLDFIKKLQNLDPMVVSSKTWSKLRTNYLSKPEFNPSYLKAKASEAISTLAQYCINMETYYLKKKEVDPKEQKLAAAEQKLIEVEEVMNVKFTELNEIKENVSRLKQKLTYSTEKAANLEEEPRRAKIHLERAEKLLGGLAEESVRWEQFAASLKQSEECLLGDSLMSAAAISMLGYFNLKFRSDLQNEWINFTKQANLLISEDPLLSKVLSDPVTIKNWQIKGLPADSLSVENAVMVTESRKTPLMIDPQLQMSKWMKNYGRDFGLIVTASGTSALFKVIENAIRFGNTVLIENVEETIEPALDSVFIKAIL
jgi:dynein heavy chain